MCIGYICMHIHINSFVKKLLGIYVVTAFSSYKITCLNLLRKSFSEPISRSSARKVAASPSGVTVK